jgi:DNA repair exonuclease SbcCD ATPase subunit
LTIDADGSTIAVERHIGREKATLTMGKDKISGTRAVNAALEQLLPIPTEYLRDVLFVAQEKLDEPLTGVESTRKDRFGRLFGCARFDRLREILQEAIVRLSVSANPPSPDQLTALNDALNSIDEQIAKANLEQGELEKALKEVDLRELYRIVSSPRQKDLLERRTRMEKRQQVLTDILSGFTEEETRTFDRAGLADQWRQCMDRKTMHQTGVCPTCGHVSEPLTEDEVAEIDASLASIEQARKRVELFDSTASEMVNLDNGLAALPPPDACVTDEMAQEAEKWIAEATKLDSALKETLSSKRFAEGKREGVVNAIKEYHSQCAEAEKVKGRLNLLTAVRDVMHRDAIQARLRKYGASRINDHLQVFSSVFNIPYRVFFTDEGIMRFIDPSTSTEHDFIELSGGQRKLVALTYRLALVRLFTRGLNLATIDEPTAYVDEENVEAMREAFISLDKFAREVGMTAFVATHEPALLPVFQRVLEVGDV